MNPTLGFAAPARRVTLVIGSMAALCSATLTAHATEGYFQYGYGARQKALAGAGVADGRDATSASLNPAGLVNAPNELSIAGTLFSPSRELEGSGAPGFTPNGTVESGTNYFLIPNLALSYRNLGVPFVDVVGITVYGNGGMNTDYPAVSRLGGGRGVFFGGATGVDFQQAFLSLALAKTLAPGLSIGVAPILARQQIKLKGLRSFAPFSSDPAEVSNNGVEVTYGGGVRGGVEWALAPQFRVGVAGNSRVYMQEFDQYSGLFAEHGNFDVPASLQAGVAFDLTPSFTLLAEYKHIWYSSIASIANPSTNLAPLGTDNGPGFGWSDIDIVKLGAEWRYSPVLTLRAGYAHNSSPISARDVEFNIIAPAVVENHFTGGFEYRWSQDLSLEAAGAYIPEEQVSGTEIAPGNPGHDIKLAMRQWEVTLGFKYRFGAGAEALK